MAPMLTEEEQAVVQQWIKSLLPGAKGFSEFRGLYTPTFQIDHLDREALAKLAEVCPGFTLGATTEDEGYYEQHYVGFIEVHLNGFDVRAALQTLQAGQHG